MRTLDEIQGVKAHVQSMETSVSARLVLLEGRMKMVEAAARPAGVDGADQRPAGALAHDMRANFAFDPIDADGARFQARAKLEAAKDRIAKFGELAVLENGIQRPG